MGSNLVQPHHHSLASGLGLATLTFFLAVSAQSSPIVAKAAAASTTGKPVADAGTAPPLGADPFLPFGRQHVLMQEELTRYQTLAESDLWQPLPAGGSLAPGARDPRVPALRSLLMQYGDFDMSDHTDDAAAPDAYDARLVEAVRRFQRRNGLKATGLVDNATRARLNTPPERHARILSANLARLQYMPREFGPRFILVNVPEYRLRLMDDGEEQFSMRVVVGKPKHATPQIATRMTRMVFNPIWRVPPSIALKELLPKGGASLSANGYHLVNHRGRSIPFTRGNISAIRRGKAMLQQKGGPGNALGRVKFVIPNHHAIFLHDTNSKHLFRKPERAFSHGCIRLEKPMEFARLMLAEQNAWSDERIARYLGTQRTRSVSLKETIPVYIAYWTAWIDSDGALRFHTDVYGRDDRASMATRE